MARYSRRQIGRARSARRTNWVAGINLTGTTAAVGTSNTQTPLSGVTEIANYTDPTLVRIRGNICLDPSFDVSTNGSQFAAVALALWVGPNLTFGAGGPDLEDPNFWASDRIIWSRFHNFGQHTYLKESGSTDVDLAVAAAQMVVSCDVDVKAQRKLEDDNVLNFSFMAVDFSSADDRGVVVSYLLRCLLKE